MVERVEKEQIRTEKSGEIPVKKIPETRIPREILGWLEKIEKGDIYLAKPVTDDQTGQVLVTAPSAKKPKIVLPLSRQQLVQGLNQKVNQAIRWLAEWCLRLIKMKPKGVVLKKIN